MEFNPDNRVVKLCAEGMEFEGKADSEKARGKFYEAWELSDTNFEKFIAAHYVARHQNSVSDKLNWDKIALEFALNMDDESANGMLPSLYLNVAKCYEDLEDLANARICYTSGKSYFDYLPDDGYGNMIKRGIESGIQRISKIEG
ncbi:rRNA adenine methyltransferase [Flavilitoribacter nigricans]|uniref:rRNA adenine methyltransferase n=1 Tax=Flavilitoribacter nigricans (strain ATCC 23147 / DSM 23189 / NBRC 102662 / NCIMB 1420 / SS-2) TaxID=1122177 RepID=A0A2D0N220_FLAN2|nr:rRNA adenine methyltransferase [Flavilitoribacter nigricans]PHN02554.1 rRNA adenine methyltransferase [Flavilitoribacter nigricans DSM 23189 = NBRC 102662]